MNIEPILVTLEVSQLVTSRVVRLEQALNIYDILVTFEVSQSLTSIVCRLVQPTNILLISVILLILHFNTLNNELLDEALNFIDVGRLPLSLPNLLIVYPSVSISSL